MGQCSTLPAEARTSSSVTSSRNDNGTYQQNSDPLREQKRRLNDGGRKESLDFNKLVDPEQEPFQMPKQLAERKASRSVKEDSISNVVMNDAAPQARDPELSNTADTEPEPMDVDSREEPPAVSIPPPPEGSIRTRCYKLNLDSDFVGLSCTQKPSTCLGPYVEPPPFLTYSASDDSSQSDDGTKVAIQTAQIFRGITISRDGTILSQNARATRSNRGNKTKKGEKSRQAAKIDKAKDLVEEAVMTGKLPDSDDPPNMVSLVVIGEYDDMKHLVRDGSKKLREAEGLPDEALTSGNRPRPTPRNKDNAPPLKSESLTSPRKRSSASPNYVNGQRTAAMQAPDKPTRHDLPQSAPPKLKSHPRDTRPMRREDRGGRVRLDYCHDFMDPRRNGVAGDGDWSHAWNLWNCGGTGTLSPLQPSSPKDGSKNGFEGREAGNNSGRDVAVAGRAN